MTMPLVALHCKKYMGLYREY